MAVALPPEAPITASAPPSPAFAMMVPGEPVPVLDVAVSRVFPVSPSTTDPDPGMVFMTKIVTEPSAAIVGSFVPGAYTRSVPAS